ncbi:hypothetical protein DPMN_009044 [Dreissena polymorpha]|uniref:Uncharacterized protein n=1 Tax=Dreissena polymorpha TaxID=45954 RepID=A0A9D4MZU7_DREPO|nr:hypothetical protein DPMN_009044 [Dreissena polymorpha]
MPSHRFMISLCRLKLPKKVHQQIMLMYLCGSQHSAEGLCVSLEPARLSEGSERRPRNGICGKG